MFMYSLEGADAPQGGVGTLGIHGDSNATNRRYTAATLR